MGSASREGIQQKKKEPERGVLNEMPMLLANAVYGCVRMCYDVAVEQQIRVWGRGSQQRRVSRDPIRSCSCSGAMRIVSCAILAPAPDHTACLTAEG